ncbi:hypothetical protein S83_056375 [Arachis hypogaea]
MAYERNETHVVQSIKYYRITLITGVLPPSNFLLPVTSSLWAVFLHFLLLLFSPLTKPYETLPTHSHFPIWDHRFRVPRFVHSHPLLLVD